METIEAKSSMWTLTVSIFSMFVGWIDANTLKESIVVAVIGTIIGYLGGKFLPWLEKLIIRKFFKKDEP